MGMENLFGVGLFQAVNHGDYFFARWPAAGHNQFMSIFGELGIFAYIFWFLFLWELSKKIEKNDYASMLFIFTLSMYTFLTGYNEWSFWLPLAMSYLISKSNLFPAHIRRIK